MGAKFNEVKFCEKRVEMMREQVTRWYNAHRDAVDDLYEAEQELRIARRG